MKIYKSNSVEDTASAAGELAAELKPGDVIALVGDLGAGKTAFVKGIAKYFHSKNDVLSPTYTLVNEYGGDIPIYHFDVYRIGDISEMDEIGYEDCFYGDGVSLIEWSQLIEEILPEHVTEITIEKDLEKGFDYRKIRVEEK